MQNEAVSTSRRGCYGFPGNKKNEELLKNMEAARLASRGSNHTSLVAHCSARQNRDNHSSLQRGRLFITFAFFFLGLRAKLPTASTGSISLRRHLLFQAPTFLLPPSFTFEALDDHLRTKTLEAWERGGSMVNAVSYRYWLKSAFGRGVTSFLGSKTEFSTVLSCLSSQHFVLGPLSHFQAQLH